MTSEWIGRALGRWRLVSDLGSGGVASVFKAVEEGTGRTAAVKVLPASVTRSPEYLRRFRREYRTMAALEHPHLLAIGEYACADGIHFYTMPFVEAPTLDQLVKESATSGGGLPVGRVVRIGIGLLRVLEYIHDQGIIHRDLKPVNMFVGADDHLILADFGLVKAVRQTAITVGPTFLGTIEYASPEQIEVSSNVDHRSDLYQVGLVLYHASCGVLPYNRRDLENIIAEKCFKEGIVGVRTFNAAVPERLEAILARATRTSPDERYGSAREMRQELESFASSLTGGPKTSE